LTWLPVSLGGVLTALPEPALERLALVPQAVFAGEWWRLWTGHFVHFSIAHALADLGVILLCGLYVERRWPVLCYAGFWLFVPLLLSVLLLPVAPELTEYRGASGLAAALAAIVGMNLWREQPHLRWMLLLLGAGFAVKILIEAFELPISPALSTLPAGVRSVWQAHVTGIALGVVWFRLTRRSTSSP
jgi:rhomboid family GlyGly-CTERM serine protease